MNYYNKALYTILLILSIIVYGIIKYMKKACPWPGPGMIILGFLLIFPLCSNAQEQEFSLVKAIHPYTQEVLESFSYDYENFYFDLATIDLGGDGYSEYVIANGLGQKPYVTIYDKEGNEVNRFLARYEGFQEGVSIATGDLNNDGYGEIITASRSAWDPNIKIYDGYGIPQYNLGFYPYGEEYAGDVSVATFDINGDGKIEIITGTGPGYEPQVKVFNRYGQNLEIDFFPTGFSSEAGINVSGIDLGGDGIGEIIISSKVGYKPLVAIYRTEGSLIREFLAYGEGVTGGVNITNYDINHDGKDEILTGPGFGGGPHVRIFNGYGQDLVNFYSYDPGFIGGIKITKGDINKDDINEIITISERAPQGNTEIPKYIDIDVSEQHFRYYEQGFLVDDLLTSTGKPSTPTRLGEFDVINKYEMAYGSGDGQAWGMPYFIGFYTSGSLTNGIHELPFIDGYREGPGSLGIAISHGCVRLDIGPAEEVYNWIEVGDKVFVHQ